MLNLSILLEESARSWPDTPAIVLGEPLSFKKLDEAACRVAASLAEMGIGRGDKVALSCLNLPFFPIVYYGILKAGATVVPLNVLLKGDEVAYYLEDSQAKVYFCFEGTPELPMGAEGRAGFEQVSSCERMVLIQSSARESDELTLASMLARKSAEFDTVQTNPDDTAVILYTSGTTGRAKGAELTHFNLFYNAECSVRLMQMTHRDTHLVVLPLFHSFGQTVQMNAAFRAGASCVLLPRFTPEAAFATMIAHQVSIFCGVLLCTGLCSTVRFPT